MLYFKNGRLPVTRAVLSFAVVPPACLAPGLQPAQDWRPGPSGDCVPAPIGPGPKRKPCPPTPPHTTPHHPRRLPGEAPGLWLQVLGGQEVQAARDLCHFSPPDTSPAAQTRLGLDTSTLLQRELAFLGLHLQSRPRCLFLLLRVRTDHVPGCRRTHQGGGPTR